MGEGDDHYFLTYKSNMMHMPFIDTELEYPFTKPHLSPVIPYLTSQFSRDDIHMQALLCLNVLMGVSIFFVLFYFSPHSCN